LDTATQPLAAGFDIATEDAWRALAERTLKGAPFETLVTRTPDGVAIQPLYTPAEAAAPLVRDPRTEADRPWDVRAPVAAANPADANAQALDALAGGAASILVVCDPAAPRGVRLQSRDDLARVLEGVLLDVAPVALDAGYLGPECAGWLGALAKSAPAAPLTLHLDPLSRFALDGASPWPIRDHVSAAASAGRDLAEVYPRASLFLASGRMAHEAGGGADLELAVALAAALAYTRALTDAGMPVAEALARIVLGLTVDQRPLVSIAKLRAARRLWARFAGAFGSAAPARIEARSSGRMLTTPDAWSNLVRLTAAGFAAAAGGADAIVLGTHADACGAVDAQALRMARNAQLILMEEAHIGRVADPLAGAWSLEALTGDLARAAWARFQAIEAAGGLIAALESGVVATEVSEARRALAGRIAAGEIKIIGVTDFPDAKAGPMDHPPRPELKDALANPGSRCPPLAPLRLEDLAA